MMLSAETAAQRDLTAITRTLTSARLALGDLSQHLLSSYLGVSARSVREWEAERDVPTVTHLIGWTCRVKLRLGILDEHGTQLRIAVVRAEDEHWEDYELRQLTAVLRARRKAQRRLAQTDLAALVGVSRASVIRWENAEGHPRTLGLLQWARILECAVGLSPMAPLRPSPTSRSGDQHPDSVPSASRTPSEADEAIDDPAATTKAATGHRMTKRRPRGETDPMS